MYKILLSEMHTYNNVESSLVLNNPLKGHVVTSHPQT